MHRYGLPTCTVIAIAITALVSACGTNGTSESTSTTTASPTSATQARPTLTASSLQPPSQDSSYTHSGGRPKVVFDPCTWVPDDVITKIGFDPSTRKRGTDMIAEYSFLTCDFWNANDETLQLDSGNISLDEDKQKYAGKFQSLSINGRDAIQVPQKTEADECAIDMRTKSGYFGVDIIVHTQGQLAGLKPCDHIVEAATALEPTIGKDN